MNIDQAISVLRDKNEAVPKPMRLPTENEVIEIEKEFKKIFPNDYRKYLLEASDVVFGCLEPATIIDPKYHTHISHHFRNAKMYGIPNDYIPICDDNADLFCIDQNGKVRYWSHDCKGFTEEIWHSLAEWIDKVWLKES